jgi:hypothetical protein
LHLKKQRLEKTVSDFIGSRVETVCLTCQACTQDSVSILLLTRAFSIYRSTAFNLYRPYREAVQLLLDPPHDSELGVFSRGVFFGNRRAVRLRRVHPRRLEERPLPQHVAHPLLELLGVALQVAFEKAKLLPGNQLIS